MSRGSNNAVREHHTMNVISNINFIQSKFDQLKEELKTSILALPDNPKIQRFGANSFTMSSSDMGNILSPSYHDFKCQYQAICDLIDYADVVNLIARLDAALTKGTLKRGNETIKLHPDVVKNVKKILDSKSSL